MKPSVKALAIALLALHLLRLIVDGSLLFYINGRFAWLTFLAVLGLLAVSAGFLGRRDSPGGHSHERHNRGASMGAIMILAVVLLATLMPAAPLGIDTAAARGVSLETVPSASTGNSFLAKSDGDKNILDWIVAFSANQNPDSFSGREARVMGFVYRKDDRFDQRTFLVSRFVITCCVADATAAGLLVRSPEAAGLAEDSWVEVAGRFEVGEFQGKSIPVLNADTVTPIPQPAQPYLYP